MIEREVFPGDLLQLRAQHPEQQDLLTRFSSCTERLIKHKWLMFNYPSAFHWAQKGGILY